MRDLDPDFASHLAGGVTTLATCWQMTRLDGEVLGFTDHDRDLIFDGVIFEAASGGSFSALRTSADLATDHASIEGALQAAALSEAGLAQGCYDGARVQVWRVNWQDVAQRLLLKSGTLGEVTYGPLGYTAEFRSLTHQLAQVQGRLYQAGCDASVGDARCGVDLSAAAFTAQAQVIGAGDHALTLTGAATFEEGWFSVGILKFMSGALSGLSFDIRADVNSGEAREISLWQKLPALPEVGAQVQLTAGCDKRFSTCREKFANQLNFRGMPYMPGNDFVMAVPGAGENHDGGRR
ncbi:MAG: DUF2163 domain-containing protein [Aquisalinus sp.]|nr:DUF2163 domain-containing protein [Aquisalinus sp.]